MRSLNVCAFLALAALFVSCDEAPTAPEPVPAATTSQVTEPLQPEAAPSAYSGELTRFEDDVAHFEGLESCAEDLGRALPSALGDLLADLRYERVVEDVCVGLAAASERDVSRCDELATRALQRGCRRRVATLLKDPSMCALDEEDTDASCLASATGRGELCASAPMHERAVCDAVARGDIDACANARVPGAATCAALVTRHGPREPLAPAAAIEVSYEGEVELPSGVVALHADVSRGLMLRRQACVPELVIEGHGAARARLSFGSPAGDATLQYFDGQTILGIPTRVTIQNLVVEPRLGGRVSGQVETDIELDGRPVSLSLAFETYVRNWLDEDECRPHDAPGE